MPDDLRKAFIRSFLRGIGWSRPKPFGPRIRRDAGPHAPRLAREAMEGVARGWMTRGQAQGALDRSLTPLPSEVRAAPSGAAGQGFGGAGFTGGVSRKLGEAPARSWVARKPPSPMVKATSLRADAPTHPQARGESSMDDAELSALIARETATPQGRELFKSVVDGLALVEQAYLMPGGRPQAEELLAKWMGDDQPALRKALSGAWLQRAKAALGPSVKAGAKRGAQIGGRVGGLAGAGLGMAAEMKMIRANPAVGAGFLGAGMALGHAGGKAAGEAVGARVGAAAGAVGNAYMRGADKVQAAGSRLGANFAPKMAGHSQAQGAGWVRGHNAARDRAYPPSYKGDGTTGADARVVIANRTSFREHVKTRNLKDKGIYAAADASAQAAGRAYAGGVARKTGNAARMAYHGAAAAGGAAAVGGAAYAGALSDKQRKQRSDAAKARWANHSRMREG